MYLVVGALVFGEAAVFLGFILPGETAVIVGGFIASQGKINIVALCVLVVVAAIVGDTVGYVMGARYGTRLLERPILRTAAPASTRRFAGSRGAAPPTSSSVASPRSSARSCRGSRGCRRCLTRASSWRTRTGGLLWGIGYTLLGYFAGHAYKRVEKYSNYAGYALIGVVAVLIVVSVRRRRRRERTRGGRGVPAEHPDEP